jgi:hypothetical protein
LSTWLDIGLFTKPDGSVCQLGVHPKARWANQGLPKLGGGHIATTEQE